MLIRPLGIKFNEIFSKIHTFSFKKNAFEKSPAIWWPFCLSLNVLREKSPFNKQFEIKKDWFFFSTKDLSIHCPRVLPQNWLNIGSGNGLVAGIIKPLPEPMLIRDRRHSLQCNFTENENCSRNQIWKLHFQCFRHISQRVNNQLFEMAEVVVIFKV